MRTTIRSQMGSKFGNMRPGTSEIAAPERVKKYTWTYNGTNVLGTLAPSLLNGSSLFLQVMMTTIKARMSSTFGQIPPPTTELTAIERLKNRCIKL